ncbi:protein kinase domain-containing protein [Lyngbya aestuarii]|uniref:protein kinase domain-containing protein n=1 Tax=Lyngbya aestuarii TaxID=118322 RepID=UPI00403DF11C
MMSNYPDFSSNGYQVNQQLGYNYQGGRFTYKAISRQTGQTVVIKQFRFATLGSDWSGHKAVEREMQVLRSLNHPGIPRYLNSFDPGDGLCLVQEYKNALPLSVPRSFHPDQLKQIAVSLLEILVYLQNQIPPVIHRDIKPENVLVDDQLNVYLVDFGFARIGGGEVVALSSMVAGTTGFMPPEQLLNRPLSKASDLYSLGATLVCLLTGTRSIELTNLIDSSFRLNFQSLVPQLSFRFIEWLQKLVQPNLNDRFEHAEAALEALKPLYVIRLPEVKLSQSSINLEAAKLGQKLTQTITISNSIPETILEANWQVAPHPSDPPHTPDTHAWISLTPAKFASNSANCAITIDTTKLMADRVYERQILLHTNAAPETQNLTIKLRTAPLPIGTQQIPYISLVMLFLTAVTLAGAAVWPAAVVENWNLFVAVIMVVVLVRTIVSLVAGSWPLAGILFVTFLGTLMGVQLGSDAGAWFGAGAGVSFGTILMAQQDPVSKAVCRVLFSTVMGAVVMAVLGSQTETLPSNFLLVGGCFGILVGIILEVLVGAGLGHAVKAIAANFVNRGFSLGFAAGVSLLAIANGISLGIGWEVGLRNPWVIFSLLGTGLPLVTLVLYTPINRRQLIAKYRQSEQHLIKP